MVCLLGLHVEFYVLSMVSLAYHLEFAWYLGNVPRVSREF